MPILRSSSWVWLVIIAGPDVGAHIFHDHGTFSARPLAMLDSGNESTGVDIEERLRFLVWIYLNVLIL
jgi:hypothetical protein